jgi:hypothetical protein
MPTSFTCSPPPHFQKEKNRKQAHILHEVRFPNVLGNISWVIGFATDSCNRKSLPMIKIVLHFFISAPHCTHLWSCYHSGGTGRRGGPRRCLPPRSCRRRSSRRCRGTGTRTSPAPPPPAASHSLGEGGRKRTLELTAKNQYRKLKTNIPRKEIVRSHSPNFHIHVSVSNFYIPTIFSSLLTV